MPDDARWTGSMPESYDATLGPALFQPYAVHVAGLVARDRPRDVLELAAGTGIVTRELLSALPDAQVTATDLNPAMVGWASERIPGATWQVADALSIDLDDASFDAVVCQFGAMFFPDKHQAFSEVARVLRPAGSFYASVWDDVSGSTFAQAMCESLVAVLPDDTPDFIVRIPHGYADPERITADLASGGLREISVEPLTLQGPAVSARSLAEGFCTGTPLRFALEQRGELTDLIDRLADEMVARLGDGELVGDMAAFMITARAS